MSTPDPSVNNPASRRPADPTDPIGPNDPTRHGAKPAEEATDEAAASPAEAEPEASMARPAADELTPERKEGIPASSLFAETPRRQAAQLINAIASFPASAADVAAGSLPPKEPPPTLAPPT